MNLESNIREYAERARPFFQGNPRAKELMRALSLSASVEWKDARTMMNLGPNPMMELYNELEKLGLIRIQNLTEGGRAPAWIELTPIGRRVYPALMN